ncbi:amidohydrolase/deacetylase family metallohydrolase [Nocardioides marmoriginsengisoli]|uniref:Amidohydrolase/deacetylase family metallohydrolase n=1 Tax=Nocardioides marmoriginsengisoli TaxID=661483 RepID=A0A3N0CGD8_9ACTN|nr:amidohydrolase family protein [Nocardioides marmoriginsengisoli]RNL62524.1 amidohydrolase/deacetylase family metallohydrolase [Nocardioides marmoriginsengisoli]
MILLNGSVLPPGAGDLAPGAVRLDGGAIADPGPPPAADEQVVDVTGLVVVPGLVDLHTHVFLGQDAGVDAQAIGPATGVTTMVDAGSVGAHLLGAFRRTSMPADGPVRVLAFLNVATIGITSLTLSGELKTPAYLSREAALAVLTSGDDTIVGVKVRPSADVAGSHGPAALRAARELATEAGLPLMVHLGPPPATAEEVLELLGPGDILTHCFTGFEGNHLARPAVAEALVAARERGVRFDLGHGQSGFDATVAARMLARGFPPDTISTDLHAYSAVSVGGLPQVICRLVALGMPLADALRAASEAPVAAIGRADSGLGTLRVGAPADVAVFDRVERPRTLYDGFGNPIESSTELVPVLTIRGGRVVHDPRGLAGDPIG